MAHICITPVGDSSDRYVAAFTSEALGATFSVVFRETVTGAVALHSFAEMLRSRYGVAPELTVVDMLPRISPVYDVLNPWAILSLQDSPLPEFA